MKISFWSPVHGQGGTTCNMIAVSLYATLMSEQSNALMQTHFNLNHLEKSLIGNQVRVVGEFFNDIGLDSLARSIRSEPLDKDTILNCSISLLNGRLNLIPGTNKANKEHYQEKIEPVLIGIVKALESYHDILFVDTNSGLNDPLTKKILDSSDLIVVNLCQNRNVLDEYFNSNPLEGKNVFYIIGKYDKDSRYSLANIRRKYKHIDKGSISTISYHTNYLDANSNAEIFTFFERCIDSKKEDKDKMFIDSVKDTTEKIMKKVNMGRRMKE